MIENRYDLNRSFGMACQIRISIAMIVEMSKINEIEMTSFSRFGAWARVHFCLCFLFRCQSVLFIKYMSDCDPTIYMAANSFLVLTSSAPTGINLIR